MSADQTALWAVPVSNMAGVARHVLDVAGNGVPGWHIELLAPDGALSDALDELGCVVHRAEFGPHAGIARSLGSLRSLVRALRPRVVHSHLAYADLASALCPMPAGVLRVSTEHGIAPDDSRFHGSVVSARVMQFAHRWRVRRFDQLVAVSAATRQAMIDKWSPPDCMQIRIIRNGRDVQVSHRAVAPRAVVASITRLAPEKRLDLALRAFTEVALVDPLARFVIAGTGPELDRLLALSEELGLTDRVEFLGHVDPEPLLQSADVVVQLSTWENCSYSLLDAVASGCGVVATDVGGNPEILPSECLVAAEPDPRVIAERILEQLSPARRPELPPAWPTVADMCLQISQSYEAPSA